MNFLIKFYARTFQVAMRCGSYFLRWRKPVVISGSEPFLQMGETMKREKASKVFVATGKNVAKTDFLKEILGVLTDLQIDFFLFDKVEPDPSIKMVEKGKIAYENEKCDSILAVGGGSSMDFAKLLGARIAKSSMPLEKMRGLFKVRKKLPLLFAIPTTSGSGSETTIAAVVRNDETLEKFAVSDLSLVPHFAVLAPKVTVSLPEKITASTGLDALTHAVEAFIGNSTTKETRKFSKDAVRLIFENLPKLKESPENLTVRENMLLASHFAGISFTRSYVGYCHAVSHALGGLYHIPHGVANAVVLPNLLTRYGKSVWKKLGILGREIGLDGESDREICEKFIMETQKLVTLFNLPVGFSEIEEKDVDFLAKNAFKEATPLYPVPKLLSQNELRDFILSLKI